jgi:hypothetical protein
MRYPGKEKSTSKTPAGCRRDEENGKSERPGGSETRPYELSASLSMR